MIVAVGQQSLVDHVLLFKIQEQENENLFMPAECIS
jgi:hypothetical protein